jgi:hypothetical protein
VIVPTVERGFWPEDCWEMEIEGLSFFEADYRRQRASELYGDRLEQLQQSIEDGSARDIAALAARFHMATGEVGTFTRSGGAPLRW